MRRPIRHIQAFSLTEVVIALGVASVTLLAIFSLFPIGMSSAVDSRRETRGAYLAQQIANDLRTSPFTNAVVLQSGTTLSVLASMNLANAQTNAFACDDSDNIISAITPAQYTSGYPSSGITYLVQVAVMPTSVPNLSQVSIETSSPGSAKANFRTRIGFCTLIGKQN